MADQERTVRPTDPYFGHFWVAAAHLISVFPTKLQKQTDADLAKRVADLAHSLMTEAVAREDWPL